ncbi:MAG: hypothetical protein ABII94_04115, partial [Patescibacteria group bacterium]
LVVGFITYGELTAKYLPFFLNSLFANLNELSNNFKVLAIDNSEQQDNQNIRYIKNNYSQISIEWAGKNIGFARAYNKMIKKSIDLIQKTFMLTEGEKYLLLECGLGEGIFFAGSKHAAIKVVASYTEDQIITSDPQQLLKIEEAKKEFEESEDEKEL